MNTAIALPEKNQNALNAVEKANSIVIATNEDYSVADSFCAGLKALEKEVDLAYDEHIQDALKAHRSLVAKKKTYAEPIDEARRIVKGKMITWADEQERIRHNEEERQRAEAKRQADEKAQAEALALENKGDHAAAAAVVQEAANSPAPLLKVKSSVPKASTVFSTRWTATVTDPNFVLTAVRKALVFMEKAKTPEGKAATEELRQAEKDLAFMTYNQVQLNGQAKAGTPYTNGVLKLGGVTFTSYKA